LKFSGASFSSTRVTHTRDSLGAATGTSAAVLTNELIYLERINTGVAHRQFGMETEATMLGVVEATADIQVGDVLTIAGGAYDGKQVRVTDEHRLPIGPEHTVLGLQVVPPGTLS
jgi:hypothetical protein